MTFSPRFAVYSVHDFVERTVDRSAFVLSRAFELARVQTHGNTASAFARWIALLPMRVRYDRHMLEQ